MYSAAKQKGFSLLEVLVAFTILSISLGTLYQLFSTSLRSAATTADYSRAMMIAESQLALVMQEVPLKETSDQGETKTGYHWKTAVTRYVEDEEINNAQFAPYQVDVQVSWSAGKGNRHYKLTTLRLGSP